MNGLKGMLAVIAMMLVLIFTTGFVVESLEKEGLVFKPGGLALIALIGIGWIAWAKMGCTWANHRTPDENQ